MFIFGLIFFMVLSMGIRNIPQKNSSSSEKENPNPNQLTTSSYANNIIIDGLKDEGYDQIFTGEGYQLYYANNRDYHYIYLSAPYDFVLTDMITIKAIINNQSYSFDLYPGINNPFIEKIFVNNTVEFSLPMDIIPNNFWILIRDYIFVLSVAPQIPSTNPPITDAPTGDDDDDDDDEGEVAPDAPSIFSGMIAFNNWGKDNWFFILLWGIYAAFVLYRYIGRPYVFYKNVRGKHFYAGRFSYEVTSEDIPGWYELYFKKWKRLKKAYSPMPYALQKPYTYMNWGLFNYYAEIIYHRVEVPENVILYEQERVKTFANRVMFVIYRTFSCLIPGVSVANKLHSYVKYEKKKVLKDTNEVKKTYKRGEKKGQIVYKKEPVKDKDGNQLYVRITEIPVIRHQVMYDKINYICDVNYNILETTTEGETKKPKDEKDKSLFYVEDLRKDEKVSDIKVSNPKVDIIPEHDLEEAIMRQNHIDNIKSIHELKKAKSREEYIKLDKKYVTARDQLDDINRHINSIINDKIVKIYQKTIVDENTIVDLVSLALMGYKECGNVQKAAQYAFDNYHKSKDIKDSGDYKTKYEIEKARNEALVYSIKKINNPLLLTTQEEELEPDFTKD